MASPHNRDLPEVVSELIIEMHEVRSEQSTVDGQLDRLNDRVNRLEQTVERGFQELHQEFCNETRQNTDRLIEASGRSMEPRINRVLDHDTRFNRL
jgi:predicted nuclease with TOPRIM domain